MGPLMAVKVQNGQQDNFSLRTAEPVRRMNRDFQIRFTTILLALLTTAAVVYAGYNLSAERQFQIPDDGVWWSSIRAGYRKSRRSWRAGNSSRDQGRRSAYCDRWARGEQRCRAKPSAVSCGRVVEGDLIRWCGSQFRWMWC